MTLASWKRPKCSDACHNPISQAFPHFSYLGQVTKQNSLHHPSSSPSSPLFGGGIGSDLPPFCADGGQTALDIQHQAGGGVQPHLSKINRLRKWEGDSSEQCDTPAIAQKNRTREGGGQCALTFHRVNVEIKGGGGKATPSKKNATTTTVSCDGNLHKHT